MGTRSHLGRLLPTAVVILSRIKAARARRVVRRFRKQIAADGESLRRFGTESGSELTGFADAVMALDTRLNAVHAQASILDLALQDHDEDKALSSAFELFKKSVDLVHSSIGIALTQETEMEQIEGKLLEHRNRFSKNSLMFRVLIIGIRAEASRLDAEHQSIFISVAAEMSRMEQQMNSGVEKAFDELDQIVQEAGSGRHTLQGLNSSLHSVAQGSIKHIRSQLDSLKDRLAPCAEASRRIFGLLGETRRQTSELITALQYQDIVQQQLQHVDEGFRDIAAHLERPEVDLAFVRTAARVQREHLRSSRSAIEGAGSQIGAASESLMGTGSRLVEEFVQMQRTASEVFTKASVGDLFGRETQKLVLIASSSEATNQRIANLLERIESSVRVFSTDISRHEFEVQLVALNAQVASARVAEARALNKLAEETASLASDTSLLIQQMRNELGDTLDGLMRMREEAAQIQETIGRERADLEAGSVAVVAKLSKLDDKIRLGSAGVCDEFSRAYETARGVVGDLRLTVAIGPAFTPAQLICDSLIAATEGCAAESGTAQAGDRVAEHERRYTMQSERDAHATAVGTSASESTPAAPESAEIEFFDVPPAATDDLPALPEARELAHAALPDTGNVELF